MMQQMSPMTWTVILMLMTMTILQTNWMNLFSLKNYIKLINNKKMDWKWSILNLKNWIQ